MADNHIKTDTTYIGMMVIVCNIAAYANLLNAVMKHIKIFL